MNKIVRVFAGLSVGVGSAAAAAQDTPALTHAIIQAGAVEWKAGPPSLAAGAQSAVLYGDPSKEGVFVMRLKLPKGFSIAPHSHTQPEIVTVVSGTFHIGMGAELDHSRMTALRPGSFFAFDPGMVHHAHAEEETIIQLSSTGPWTITYVNPADDPRRKR